MKINIAIAPVLIISILSSCTAPRLAIPAKFTEQATAMEVKGWNSYKRVQFGNYKTTKVKRGFLLSTKRTSKRVPVQTEDRVTRIFGVKSNNVTERQKDRFRYTINDGNRVAEVLASEGNIQDFLEVKTGNRWLGDFNFSKNNQYSFSAVIIPVSHTDTAAWQLVVYNGEHPPVDPFGRKSTFRFPLELGYATNGTDTVTIKQIRVTKSMTPKGKEAIIPFEVPGGYELRMDDGVVALINSWNHEVWMYNDLDEPTKLVLSAIASSLMLRKIKSIK